MSEQVYKDIIYYLVEFKFLTYHNAVMWMHSENIDLKKKPVDLVKEGRAGEVWEVVLKIAISS